MACLTACVAEALVVYGIKKSVEKHHKNLASNLNNLIIMLLGGSFLLFIEHVWHGEITFFYPFLTAMNSPDDTKQMVHEILTVGVSMDIAITAIWFCFSYIKSFSKLFTVSKKA